MNQVCETIQAVILEMDRPFNISDLFYILETEYNIQNRPLILAMLDELCESGALDYSEVNDDCWAFSVCH